MLSKLTHIRMCISLKLGPLLPEELTKVLLTWIHSCQQTTLANEFVNLNQLEIILEQEAFP